MSLLVSLPLILVLTTGYEDSLNWKLAFNIHPADGHNMGYGADAWDNHEDVGADGKAFEADYKSYDVTIEIANFVAIARHQNGICEAARVWKFLESGNTLLDYVDIQKTKRLIATSEENTYSYISTSMENKDKDPIFGADDGALTFNWWYGDNGVRIGNSKTHHTGLLPEENYGSSDSYMGLGGEFYGDTRNGASSTGYWYDVGTMSEHCWGSDCSIQGTDHGTGINDGTMYGQYAIYVSDVAEDFPCEGQDLEISMYDEALVQDFERADKSDNGFVDFDEIMFEIVDLDEDGSLSPSEYATARSHNRFADTTPFGFEEITFEIADLDGDGILSPLEYSEARSHNRFEDTASETDIVNDFIRIDKDDDVLLTIDEIAFDVADIDKDSELSLEEFAKARSRAGTRLGKKD